MNDVALYAGDELGAFGFHEKPWYIPGARQAAFLGEIEARGLSDALTRRVAPAASDADLQRFHTPDHVRGVRDRCATNRGSLDSAAPVVNERSRKLLSAIAAAEQGSDGVTAADVAPVLVELDATLDAFAPYLQSEGLVIWDLASQAVRLTAAGHAFLADPAATLGGPTYARAHAEQAARFICGAVLDATERIAAGELSTVFIPISGFHHAFRDEARNYCLYNDSGLAVAAALALVPGNVAYIDIDIHRGDGVYAAFEADPRAIVVDLHQAQVEPGSVQVTEHSGRDGAAGTKLGLALGSGHTDASYLAAWERAEAFVRAADPDFVVFECGVDGLAGDPMSDQALTPAVFAEVARRVKALARTHAGGRLLVLGGGGYALKGTARGWAAVVEALLEES